MKISGRPAAMLLIGLGLGAIAGAYLHSGALWSGLALAMVGVGVAITSRPPAPQAPADPGPDKARDQAT
jgi:hypothetical protein